jgi:hypothetical protein
VNARAAAAMGSGRASGVWVGGTPAAGDAMAVGEVTGVAVGGMTADGSREAAGAGWAAERWAAEGGLRRSPIPMLASSAEAAKTATVPAERGRRWSVCGIAVPPGVVVLARIGGARSEEEQERKVA